MNPSTLLCRADLVFRLLDGDRLEVKSREPLSADERHVIAENKPAIVAALRAPLASRWRLIFPNGEARSVQCGAPVPRATILRDFPEAVDAQVDPVPPRMGRPLSDGERKAVLNWLAEIGESRPEQISATLAELEVDDGLRAYVLAQSEGLRAPIGATCGSCGKFSVDAVNPAGGLGRCATEGFLRGPGRTACSQFSRG